MTLPLLRAEEAREWLRLAARDLRVAELALRDTPPLVGEALCHAQQAAEKALKGFLVWHGEVLRRRLCEDLGPEKARRTLAKLYADWCFERRARLPAEWTAVDSASTESKAREFLMSRFEACYPFHPSTLSVFQRKWQALPQYQQTRGTLAMLAQWVSWAYREGYQKLRREAFLTLGSAPLHVPEFRGAVLGQLGDPRLAAAIEADIAGSVSHARALDADAKPPLNDIHRRVATTILFESSGGQRDKIAHLPDLRFALGEPPDIETTSIDNAAAALETRAFFIRKVSSDGFQIRPQATLKKVVNDRRASLDPDDEVRPAMRAYIKEEFKKGAPILPEFFPKDSTVVANTPKLQIVVMEPGLEWSGAGPVRAQVGDWTRLRGGSTRDYPAALVWCLKKPGRELQEKVELALAWQRVEQDIRSGVLGTDVDPGDRADVASKLKDAQEAARDEVWASYRFVVIADAQEPDGLRTIDLGAGHVSSRETLCGRVISALNSDGRLSESVGAGYLERNWPPALRESGAWPLKSLQKSFFDGSLTRLLDPDAVLSAKIPEFVQHGDFGPASGATPDGAYQRVWFEEPVPPEEVSFDYDVYLLRKDRAKALRQPPKADPSTPSLQPPAIPPAEPAVTTPPQPAGPTPVTLTITGAVPPESWNRFGSKVIPKLRSGEDLSLQVDLSCRLDATTAPRTQAEIRQLIDDLGLTGRVTGHTCLFLSSLQGGRHYCGRVSKSRRYSQVWCHYGVPPPPRSHPEPPKPHPASAPIPFPFNAGGKNYETNPNPRSARADSPTPPAAARKAAQPASARWAKSARGGKRRRREYWRLCCRRGLAASRCSTARERPRSPGAGGTDRRTRPAACAGAGWEAAADRPPRRCHSRCRGNTASGCR